MSASASDDTAQALAFGPFRLIRSQKLLLEHDRPVRLGGRALDLLTALVERAGEVVGRDELVARAWPTTIVEETSLRVHVAALRKVLGDGHAGARFITNVRGRGYCFVAPVTRLAHVSAPVQDGSAPGPHHNLPARLTHMIGRDQVVAVLAAQLPQQRFLTLTGPGGMGKTTVALAVAEALLAGYRDGVRFVDLAPVVSPSLVPGTLASVLQIAVPSHDSLSALGACLREREMLVVLDNCEHVVEAAAILAESLLQAAPRVHILATSREPLNAEGECVHRLGPLEMPPASTALTAAQALNFPAIQFFAQRALAVSDSFELSDANAPVLRDLCRQLDGMPLAIELAAARVDSLGVRGLAARLDDRLRLLAADRRTALPRHRTLRALIDWSFELLSEDEQAVLCRLAVFRTGFTVESAGAVASDEALGAPEVVDGLMNLCAKSLLSIDASGDAIRYRLLDTTRAYALEKLMQSGQGATVFSRHARHVLAQLTRAEEDWDTMTRAQWIASYCPLIDDVRAALDWSFSSEGELSTGVALTAAALLPVYELGLLDEYHERIEHALDHIHRLSPAQPALEMRLNAVLIFPSGRPAPRMRPQAEVLARTVELARQLGEPKYQVAALYSMWGEAFRSADYASAAGVAKQLSQLALRSADAAAISLSDRLLAQTCHFMGDHAAAKLLAERVLRHPPRRMPPAYISPVPRRVAMRIVLARILWIEGHPDQAAAMAEDCMAQAAEHPFALTQALALAACPIALWRGDDLAARALVDRLMEHATRHPSAYWQSWPQGYDAVLRLRAAPATSTLPLAANAMERDCLGTLAEALAGAETIARVAQGSVGWCAPEILRAQGENTLARGMPQAAAAAESKFLQSLGLARRQGALSWELRAASSLARLRHGQGRGGEAHRLLAEVHGRFTEGFATADLRAARSLLDELAPHANSR